MDKIKFFFKSLSVLFIVVVCNFVFLNDVQSYTRVMLHEMYKDGPIDVLFLGASHVYRGINTQIVEERTKLNVFNASTSSQQLQGSFYMLKEANENNGVSTVLLDVGYIMNAYAEDGTTETYIITDYMKEGINKYSYLYNALGVDGVINGFLPLLHNSTTSLKTIATHFSKDYMSNSYEPITYDNEAYYGQGFVYSYEVVDEDFCFVNEWEIDADAPISEYTLTYLKMIIDYCQENGIELILIDCPMPDGTLNDSKNYDKYVEEMQEIANENNIEYWNFNLCKKNVLELERKYYKDTSHLNGLGADIFTKCLCDIYMGMIEEPFYTKYQDKVIYNPDNTF